MNSRKIFFIHRGDSWYLKYTLSQMHYFNPECEIILLGDESNNRYDFVTHYKISDYTQEIDDFAAIYKHLSPNGYSYEIFCFQRWIILNNFVKKHKIEGSFFYFDSDVLMLSNIQELISTFKLDDFDITVSHEESPHCLFFHDLEILQKFVNYLFKLYKDEDLLQKLVEHYEKRKNDGSLRILGGVSNMTAFCYFSKCSDTNVLDITKIVIDKKACDHNINVSDGYKMNEVLNIKAIKKVRKVNDVYFYCIDEKSKESIRFLFFHFQGSAKRLMTEYYLCKKFKLSAFFNLRSPIKKFFSFKRFIVNKIRRI